MSKRSEALEVAQAAEKRLRIEKIRDVIQDGVSDCPECNASWTLPEPKAVNKVMLHDPKCAAYVEPKTQDA